ncbi:MFS transporter, partial [Enterococcus faecium]
KKTINFATSLIFIGCNIGIFIAPISMQLAQFLTRSTSLTAPFFVFAGIFMVVLFVTFFATKKKTTRVMSIF